MAPVDWTQVLALDASKLEDAEADKLYSSLIQV